MNYDIQQIELSIETAKKAVELRNAVQRLQNNRDFRKVFIEHLFKDEAVRLVSILGINGFERMDDVTTQDMRALALIQQMLRNIINFGNTAEAEILDHEQSLDEIREELEAE